MDHGASEFWGFENFEGHYDVINGVKRQKVFFSTCGTNFRTEKRFQENGRLRVVCHHLGCNTTPWGLRERGSEMG